MVYKLRLRIRLDGPGECPTCTVPLSGGRESISAGRRPSAAAHSWITSFQQLRMWPSKASPTTQNAFTFTSPPISVSAESDVPAGGGLSVLVPPAASPAPVPLRLSLTLHPLPFRPSFGQASAHAPGSILQPLSFSAGASVFVCYFFLWNIEPKWLRAYYIL